MRYTERNVFEKNCFFESLLSIEMSYIERNGVKMKRFGRWPIWKCFFSNQFCQSRWPTLSETLQESNCLTESAFEKDSFSNPFLNRENLILKHHLIFYGRLHLHNLLYWNNHYHQQLLQHGLINEKLPILLLHPKKILSIIIIIIAIIITTNLTK